MTPATAGREVSNRAVRVALEACRRRGIDERPLLEGFAVPEGLAAPDGRHSWDDHARFLCRLQDAVGGPGALEGLFEEALCARPTLQLLGRLRLEPRARYAFAAERIVRFLFRDALGLAVRSPASQVVEIEFGLREPFAPSLPLMHSWVGGWRAMSRLFGFEGAVLEAELEPRRARYRIELPPALRQGPTARLPSGRRDTGALDAALELGFDTSELTASAQALGQRLVADRTPEALAGALADALDGHFCCGAFRLWERDGAGEYRLRCGLPADLPIDPVGWSRRELLFAGQEVGRLEVALQHPEESPFFEALLPWIALAIVSSRSHAAHRKREEERAGGLDAAALEAHARAWELTRREGEVLELLARGLSNKEIAASLGIGIKTCETHVSVVLRKADAESRAALIARLWAGR